MASTLVIMVILGMVLFGGGIGVFLLLMHLGVIANEARRPPHQDSGNYQISKGREVRAESDNPVETHSSREQ
jgi:multisubunit Na+/H+ antiporter MnhC subunit